MSKTITLETAKKLKAAFDKAGIEVPETERYWAYVENSFIDGHYLWKVVDQVEAQFYDQNPI